MADDGTQPDIDAAPFARPAADPLTAATARVFGTDRPWATA